MTKPLHNVLTDKFEWYDACLRDYDRRLGYEHLRPTLVPLLKHLDRTSASRIAVLAERMSVTRRRVAQIVAEGVQDGVLQTEPDPDDKRAVLVRHSAQGQLMVDRAIESIALVEAEIARRIGRKNVQRLVELLGSDWGPAVLRSVARGPDDVDLELVA
jgi:DNA-binding MarR family transcriptional regulator